ncbi:TonB-dependent receptor [soil metagenome]
MKQRMYWSSSALALSVAICTCPVSAVSAEQQAKASETISEVIVTATKRATNLQDVPMVVDVVSNKDLERASLSQMQDVQTLVPGLNIQQTGTLSQYYIRGVGGTVTGPADQPGISLNIDGVYSQSPVAGHVSFYDLDHIEVLKGPQGTLFGRNSTGGAINLTTHNPVFANHVSVGVDLGNYGRKKVEAMANYAISDQAAVRLAAVSTEHDGYFKDGLDDEDNWGVRGKLLYQPDDRLSILIGADYGKEGGKGSGMMPLVEATGHSLTSDPRAGPTDPVVVNLARTGIAPIFGYPTGDFSKYARQDNETGGVNGQVDYDLGPVGMTLLASHHRASIDTVSYIAAFVLAQAYKTTESTAELRFTSKDEDARFKYVAGLYFYDQGVSGDVLGLFGSAGSPILSGRDGGFDPALVLTAGHQSNTDNHITDQAIFGQGQFQIVDKLSFTLGARYLNEKQTNKATSQAISVGVLGAKVPSLGEREDDRVIWRAGFDYTPTVRSTIYAYASSGWKSGGLAAYDAPYNSYKPEALTAYSIGSKNRFFDNRLQVNGELFYWDYTNRQLITFLLVTTGGVPSQSQVTVNSKQSHIQGAQLDVQYRASAHDTIGFAVEYIDEAKNDDFISPSLTPVTGCSAIGAMTYDCSGSNMTQEPKFSGNVSYEHIFEMRNGGQVSLNVRSKFQTKMDLQQSAQTEAGRQGAYTLTNLNLAYAAPSRRWSAGAYVTNLEDRLIRLSSVTSPVTGTSWSNYMAPRTYGLQLKFEY